MRFAQDDFACLFLKSARLLTFSHAPRILTVAKLMRENSRSLFSRTV